MVLEGEVKLSINSTDGRRLSLSIARKGEILGLCLGSLGESIRDDRGDALSGEDRAHRPPRFSQLLLHSIPRFTRH